MLRLSLSLPPVQRLSHWVALYLRLYTHVRAKTTGVSIYLFSISEAILPVHEDWKARVVVFRSRGRGKTARFFSVVRALRSMEYLITAFTVEREENNVGPAPNGSARERTALCLPRTSNCFGWGESAITAEQRSRISLRRYVNACVYVFARLIHVEAVAETKLTSDNY